MDFFLATHLPQLTRSRIKQLISDGFISCSSGKPVKGGQKVRGDETFEVILPEAEPIEALPEDIPLNVLYEDSDIIVIDKPAGMVVHPAAGHFHGTLVNALLFHCKDLSGIGGMLRPGIVHRLDKGTSGVMLATKNDQAHNAMALQFKSHSINRKYRALVYGQMARSGTVDLPLGRNPNDRKKIAVIDGGRKAVTHWKLLARYQGLSLVELTLETGRTHQIRVHLSHQGHPIAGDPSYGSNKRAKEIQSTQIRSKVLALERQALHAYFLGFDHPKTGKSMEFISPMAQDMAEIIQLLDVSA